MKVANTFWQRLEARDKPRAQKPMKAERRMLDEQHFDGRGERAANRRDAHAGREVPVQVEQFQRKHRGKSATQMVRLFVAQGLSGSSPRLSDRARANIVERRKIGDAKLQAALEAAMVREAAVATPTAVQVRRKHGGTTQ